MITIGFIGIGGALLIALAVTGINILIHQMKSDSCTLVSGLTNGGTVTTFFGEETPVSERILQDEGQRALLIKDARVIVRHGTVVGIVPTPTGPEGGPPIAPRLTTGVFTSSKTPGA